MFLMDEHSNLVKAMFCNYMTFWPCFTLWCQYTEEKSPSPTPTPVTLRLEQREMDERTRTEVNICLIMTPRCFTALYLLHIAALFVLQLEFQVYDTKKLEFRKISISLPINFPFTWQTFYLETSD